MPATWNWETIDYSTLDYDSLTTKDIKEINAEEEKRKAIQHPTVTP